MYAINSMDALTRVMGVTDFGQRNQARGILGQSIGVIPEAIEFQVAAGVVLTPVECAG